MDTSPHSANSSTPRSVPGDAVLATGMIDEDDLALGWECANPALQIESWRSEAAAQPLHQVY